MGKNSYHLQGTCYVPGTILIMRHINLLDGQTTLTYHYSYSTEEEMGTERLNNLPRSTQQVSGSSKFLTRAV